MNNFLRNSKSISNRKAITTPYSDKSKKHTLAGQFYLLRVLESVQYSDFSIQLFRRWEAPSKDNANTTALNTQLIKTIDEFPTYEVMIPFLSRNVLMKTRRVTREATCFW